MQAISPVLRSLLVASVAGAFVSCKTLGSLTKHKMEPSGTETDPAPPPPPPGVTILPVGVVHLVDPSGKFVLIRSSRALHAEPGTLLATRGGQGEETARLQVSPARKGSFLTADILEGSPRTGETVTLDHSAAAPGSEVSSGEVSDPNAVQVLE